MLGPSPYMFSEDELWSGRTGCFLASTIKMIKEYKSKHLNTKPLLKLLIYYWNRCQDCVRLL